MSEPIYHGRSDLIWGPEQRVSTFPSGLILVQREAVCRRSQDKRSEIEVGTAIPSDGAGDFDGLYIFPAPQSREDQSFRYYDVSAYGRTSDSLLETFSDVLVRAVSTVVESVTINARITTLECRQIGVIPSADSTPYIPPSRSPVVTTLTTIGLTTTEMTYISYWESVNATRTPYGHFDEFVMTWRVFVEA